MYFYRFCLWIYINFCYRFFFNHFPHNTVFHFYCWSTSSAVKNGKSFSFSNKSSIDIINVKEPFFDLLYWKFSPVKVALPLLSGYRCRTILNRFTPLLTVFHRFLLFLIQNVKKLNTLKYLILKIKDFVKKVMLKNLKSFFST